MKINTKKIVKLAQDSLVLAFVFVFLISLQVLAATTPTFNQDIVAGSISVDIVDASGVTVAAPAVTFEEATFSFSTQDTTGSFAPTAERIRASNPTGTEEWTVNLAASATTDTWTDGGSNEYDFNDAGGYVDDGATTDVDAFGGEMTVDPSGGTLTEVDSCGVVGISKGTEDAFEEGVTDSIDIMVADGTATAYCQYDFIGDAGNILQKIPAGQAAASYSIDMTVTIQ